MKRLILSALMLGAAACQPMPETDVAGPTQTPTAAECAARGGELKPVGRMQSIQCVITYADAGKRCTDGDQCAGDCRLEDAPFPEAGTAAVGQCAATSDRFGCHATVEDGKATPALCID